MHWGGKRCQFPTIEEAFANLERVGADRVLEGLTRRAAELNAAAQHALTKTMYASTIELRDRMSVSAEAVSRSIDQFTNGSNENTAKLCASVDALTAASNANTEEMSKGARATARWTMALVFVTIALVLVAIAQIVVMIRTAH